MIDQVLSAIQLNPTSQQSQPVDSSGTMRFIHVPRVAPITYTAFLGHNLHTVGGWCYPQWWDGTTYHTPVDLKWLVNSSNYHTAAFGSGTPDYDGFSLALFSDSPGYPSHRAALSGFYNESFYIGAVSVGSFYDLQAPNLSLTLSQSAGNTKEYTTIKGSSGSNTMGNTPPRWGNLGAWELTSSNDYSRQALSRSYRRSWDLKFSFMGSSDLWGSNQMLSTYPPNDPENYDSADLHIGYGGAEMVVASFGNMEAVSGTADTFDGVSYNGFHVVMPSGAGADRYYLGGQPEFSVGQKFKASITYKVDGDGLFSNYGSFVGVNGLYENDPDNAFEWLFLEAQEGQGGTSSATDGFITKEREFICLYDMPTNSGASVGDDDYNSLYINLEGYLGAEITIKDISIKSADGGTEDFRYNLLTDQNYFSEIWAKTLGGTLPFILQPDPPKLHSSGTWIGGNNQPDGFAICKFVDNSLKANLVAPNLYDISVKIEEVY